MRTIASYSDFVGNAAADISNKLSIRFKSDKLISIAKYFNLDENRFKIVALSIFGTKNFSVSLICIDKHKSTESKEHIVCLHIDINDNQYSLNDLFDQLSLILYDKFEEKYINKEYDEEANFKDFH